MADEMKRKQSSFLNAIWNQLDESDTEEKDQAPSKSICQNKNQHGSRRERNQHDKKKPDFVYQPKEQNKKSNWEKNGKASSTRNREKLFQQQRYSEGNRGNSFHKVKKEAGVGQNLKTALCHGNSDTSSEVKKWEKRPMGFKKLKELSEKDPNEILFTLSLRDYGFHLTLQSESITRDTVAYILIDLGKACTAPARNNVFTLINSVTSNKEFMLIHVQRFLAGFERFENQPYHFKSLTYLIDFLESFQQSQPSSAADIILIQLPLLKIACQKVFPAGAIQTDRIMAKIEELEKQNDYFLKKYTQEEIKKLSARERIQLQTPPESYRSIPILPSESDVHQACTFLRPNIVQGRYIDTEHYLDVQFRLLREDYVRPLRDGITEYLRVRKCDKSLKRNKDVRVYENVHIIKEQFVNGTLVHIAHFDSEEFKKIRWEYSKRFLTGSLLCLTSDDFKTMLFASVARRVPEDLKKGLLLLRFEEVTDEVLNINPLINFVIVETDAYFEAYRYNLNALHDLSEDNLPMKNYIVEVEKEVKRPQYLSASTTYDMRPLLLPMNTDHIQHTVDDGEERAQYNFPQDIKINMGAVRVLNDNYWPTAKEIGLDDSQYAAVKAAVTKEFAIIQGPPGTGKTYVGLRIVQLLLHNYHKWQPSFEQATHDECESDEEYFNQDKSPILIVCYTNHALDQFLEGVLLFTHRIVRIGGRGSNEALADYQLNNLKKKVKERREVPNFIFGNMRQKNWELRNLKENIDSIRKSVEKSYRSVLSENVLRDYMVVRDKNHYDSLKEPFRFLNDIVDSGSIIHTWLDINSACSQVLINFSDSLKIASSEEIRKETNKKTDTADNDEVDTEEVIESDGEADVEYLEAQRNIDDEEYADVWYVIEDDVEEPVIERAGNQEGWKIQGGMKAVKHYMMQKLKRDDLMSEEEAMNVSDVWHLLLEDRWRLYKFWLHGYIKAKQTETLEMQQRLRREYKDLLELRIEEDLHVLQNAYVVGMTTTGASKYRQIVQRLNPRIVIVEEAAEILESHIVTSLAPDTQHVILIGDHQQLRPSPTVHCLAVKYDLNVSLFERMVKNGMECHRLGVQHRMRPEIAALLVPHIYSDLQNHESVMNFENIKGIGKNVFFVSHSFTELQEYDSKSRVNQHEAKFLIKLCKHLILQGYESSQITVLTTYSGQLFALKKLVTGGILKNVRITVVDNFQGEENDIILISFVRSNEEGEIGFLKISNRVCVALSRAKKSLYCIGNFNLLAEKSDLWKNIVATLNQQNAIGSSLQLVCQNHPDVSTIVATETDFAAAPEGGCKRQCDYRLTCGHTCSLVCHPYDPSHESVRCLKPCIKTLCEYKHPCEKKCYEKCGNCVKIISKTLIDCHHTIDVQCHLFKSATKCTKNCERLLSCGHKCPYKCSEPCIKYCKEFVTVHSPICGHEVKVECSNSENVDSYVSNCKEPCKTELQCGHICSGSCSKCRQGRLHVVCSRKCNRILVCGHACKALCSKSCPPCNRKCENCCKHNKCPLKCGEPCGKCNEPCDWICEHKKCLMLCGEPCDRKPCDEPCKNLLKCNHPCIGLCGEKCPKLCRICNEEKVTEMFFGSEDEPDARFVLLEDCGHMFEVEQLTHWMEMDSGKVGEIQMKVCPRCKTVVRRNQRFGNIIKSCLGGIEKVKAVTFGDTNRNNTLRLVLLNRIKNMEISGFGPLIKPIMRVLMAGKKKSVQEITTLENVFNVALEFLNATKKLNNYPKNTICINSFSDESVKSNMENILQFMRDTAKFVKSFIQDEYLTASEQQLHEILREIHRLEFFDHLLKLTECRLIEKANENIAHIAYYLTKFSPFSDTEESKIKTHLQQLASSLGSAVLNISVTEKASILKAMALARGHWYQCPNGHVYCITECGGAMEVGHCNECGALIGGSSHALLRDNRVASDMDGANHSAWSDAQNLQNYEF